MSAAEAIPVYSIAAEELVSLPPVACSAEGPQQATGTLACSRIGPVQPAAYDADVDGDAKVIQTPDWWKHKAF